MEWMESGSEWDIPGLEGAKLWYQIWCILEGKKENQSKNSKAYELSKLISVQYL